MDGSVNLELRIECAGQGQVLTRQRQQIVEAHLVCVQAQMELGVRVECRNAARRRCEAPIRRDFRVSAAQQAVRKLDALSRVTAGEVNRIPAHKSWLNDLRLEEFVQFGGLDGE